VAVKRKTVAKPVPRVVEMANNNPLQPTLVMLIKLGSIAVHADEITEDEGHAAHAFDMVALRQLIDDPEVKAWIKEMGAYLPLKRTRHAGR
jgi:hypothetical protein